MKGWETRFQGLRPEPALVPQRGRLFARGAPRNSSLACQITLHVRLWLRLPSSHSWTRQLPTCVFAGVGHEGASWTPGRSRWSRVQRRRDLGCTGFAGNVRGRSAARGLARETWTDLAADGARRWACSRQCSVRRLDRLVVPATIAHVIDGTMSEHLSPLSEMIAGTILVLVIDQGSVRCLAPWSGSSEYMNQAERRVVSSASLIATDRAHALQSVTRFPRCHRERKRGEHS